MCVGAVRYTTSWSAFALDASCVIVLARSRFLHPAVKSSNSHSFVFFLREAVTRRARKHVAGPVRRSFIAHRSLGFFSMFSRAVFPAIALQSPTSRSRTTMSTSRMKSTASLAKASLPHSHQARFCLTLLVLVRSLLLLTRCVTALNACSQLRRESRGLQRRAVSGHLRRCSGHWHCFHRA